VLYLVFFDGSGLELWSQVPTGCRVLTGPQGSHSAPELQAEWLQMRISKRWRMAMLWILAALSVLGLTSRRYIWLFLSRKPAPKPAAADLLVDSVASKDPQILLAEANRLAWVFNWPKAGPLYARAEKLFRERGDERDEIYARVGRIRAESQQAMSFVEVSEMLAKQLENPVVENHPRLRLWCLAAKGYTDIEIDPASSERAWTGVRRIAKLLGETQWEARATGELGTIAFLDGDSVRAGTMVGSALLSAMRSGDLGEQVRSLEMLGNGFNEVKRYTEAIGFFDRAIKVARSTPDAGFPFMAFEGKSQALIGQGELNEARRVLDQALTVTKKGNNLGHEAHILNLLGELSARMGDRDKAVKDLQDGSQLALKYKYFRTAAEGLFKLARLYLNTGDLKSAEESATLGLDASRRVGDRYFTPRDLTMLADLKARQGRLEQANAWYEQAEDVIDGMLVNLDEPYWNSSLAGAMSETYLHHFELLARVGNVAQEFELLERVRGRTAAALLENRVSFRKEESPTGRALDASVSELQVRLMRSNDPEERERLKERLFEDERRLAWAQSDRGVSRHEWLERPAPLKAIQAVLRPDELVLEYVLDEPHAYCLWITRQRAGLTLLPAGRIRIEELTRRYLNAVRAKRDDPRLAKELYAILLAPVTEEATHDRLIVVPDGLLYFLPFDTLRSAMGSFLVESRTISYVPAATILEILRSTNDSQQASRSFLGVGDVPYQDQGDVSGKLPEPQGIEKAVLRGLSDLLGTPLHDLPQTREEVIEVNRIVGNDGVILLGSHATEAAFESEPLADFRIVHLAVHGFADTQFPERSGLVLGVGPNSRTDGLLEIRQIMRLHFNADLVTLSACDTGVGKVEGEEGITNLAEAFLESGAKAVVASLWSADDTYTRDLMVRFYTHIAEGQDKATALREAKVDLLAKYGKQVPPYYWGAFVLVGDGGSPISLRVQ
jgi:CHAT domain-containing protein